VERERIHAAARAARWGSAAVIVTLCLLAAAQTAAAGPCPNEDSPGFRSYLPDCRAYELVSPPYKNEDRVSGEQVSEDGSQVLVTSGGFFANPENAASFFKQRYVQSRTASGWQSLPLNPQPYERYEMLALSSDFQSVLARTKLHEFGVGYVTVGSPGASPTQIGPEGPESNTEAIEVVGQSADLSVVAFSAHEAQHEKEPHLWPGDTTAGLDSPSLYEYAGTGRSEPTLVGVSDIGVPASVATSHLISDCGTELGANQDVYNAVSASGATIFFTSRSSRCGASGPPVNELYARIDRGRTVAISEPSLSVAGRECTGTCATAETEPGQRQAGLFAGASLDGSKVFFTTGQRLVNGDTNSGVDLYEEELHEGVVTRLVQVSHAAGPTGVLSVARISEDGSHVYFYAGGVLSGANKEGQAPVAGQRNLYEFSRECPGKEAVCVDPVERRLFVATVPGGGPVQTTPDGRFLVFTSAADLTPDEERRAEAGQVFEYDAQSETLARVSRGQNGYNEDGNSSIHAATIPLALSQPTERFTNLAVSAGGRVFFSTEDALTPQATNGVMNIYEYHDGQVGLITDGHDATRLAFEESVVELLGTDESGTDVFFMTADRLVPQDGDNQVDVYDARVAGGFPAPAQAVGCAGDGCRGAVSSPPLLPPASSATRAAEGSLSPPVRPRSRVGAKSVSEARKLTRALTACKKGPKKKRRVCEARARRQFGAKAKNSNRRDK
jgi:hypothetical protein